MGPPAREDQGPQHQTRKGNEISGDPTGEYLARIPNKKRNDRAKKWQTPVALYGEIVTSDGNCRMEGDVPEGAEDS